MQQITIERNGQKFGPYSQAQILHYIENNKLLLNDLARIDNSNNLVPLRSVLKQCGCPLPRAKNPLDCIKKIGVDFIFPWQEIKSMSWLRERRFIYLSVVGLLPLLIVFLSLGTITYIAIATYFSLLWGLFFFYVFKTDQVIVKECLLCFGVTAFVSTTALLIIHAFGFFSFFNSSSVYNNSFPTRFIGMFLTAGLPEELCKAAVIFWLVRRPGKICNPQTIVLYGLFSGLGFGINEGVCYQLNINRTQGIDNAYFLNVLRLTSLPFLHAIWCAIASYFIAFSAIFPMFRHGLWLIAILLPALIHALYNSLGFLGLLPASMGVLLLTIYLVNAKSMQQKLT
jgi:RsiW-degrading membrane proteinase PrsW (M82 family)